MNERHPSDAHKLARATAVLLSIVFAPAIAADSGAPVIRLSEPVETTAEAETFGTPFVESSSLIELTALLDNTDQYLGRPVSVSARVAQVCQKKGCFFIAQDGDATIRVSFKDYGFFVPTDIGGRRVTLAGELVRRDLSADQADHYNADLGGTDKAVQAGVVYEIVATSVRVPRG